MSVDIVMGVFIVARRIRIHEFGGPEVLRIEDSPVGEPGADEVRLRIHAIGINRTEITLRSGRVPTKPALPTLIGFEAAGGIDALGAGVNGFALGDRVALVPTYSASQYGLYGELALVPARSLVPIPANVSFETAAATWVAFGTAWSGLVAVGELSAGQSVLINAASSSVGLAAIQIAKRIGAHPIALTRSGEKAAVLWERGAAAVIATARQDVVVETQRLTEGRGANLVFDPVGGPAMRSLLRATAAGGTLILYGALDQEPTTLSPFDIFARDVRIRGVALSALARDPARLSALKRFVSAGLADRSLVPIIDRIYAFDAIADAHRYMEAGGQVGKIVVTV